MPSSTYSLSPSAPWLGWTKSMTYAFVGLIEPYLSGDDVAGHDVAEDVVVFELANSKLLLR